MIYVIYVVLFLLYSWFLIETSKATAKMKDTIKLVITGKPEQVKEAIKIINEQSYLLK